MIKNFSLIEQRADKAEPYEQALTDIYSCYCHQREQLIGPGVFSSFADLKDGRDVCGLGKFTSSIRIINFRFDKKNHRIFFFSIIFCEFQYFSKNEFYKKYTCKFVISIVSDFFQSEHRVLLCFTCVKMNISCFAIFSTILLKFWTICSKDYAKVC